MSAEDDAVAPTIAQTAIDTAVPTRPSAPSIGTARPGDVVGRYRLIERLGAGAMGVVWSAQDPQLDRRVAIKLVHPQLARSPDAAARLLREARAMAKLSSRAVITVYDAGEVDGTLFLAMELVRGTTLGALLRARGAKELADWKRWLGMMLEAGRGLAAAHHAGVLHRDFKPDNVLVEDSGRVCVGDFGVASLGEVEGADASRRWRVDDSMELTTTGALLGTPVYMSPQQLRGEPVDARADQFGFCVATYEALYGTRPFAITQRGLDAIPALAATIERGELVPPPAGTQVPERVREVLVRGLAASPAARWPDLEVLCAELERAAGLGRRVRARVGLALGTLGVLAGGAALGLWASHAPELPEARPLFGVPARTRIALSPDGQRIAYSDDRLTVRDLDGEGLWELPLSGYEAMLLDFDAREVRYATRGSRAVARWRFLESEVAEEIAQLEGTWLGTSALGEVFQRPDHRVAIARAGTVVREWQARGEIFVLDLSPDRRRLAYLESDRFFAHLVVRDLDTGVERRTGRLVEATAVTWLDDTTLAYAVGVSDNPRIYRLPLEPGGFGDPSLLHERPTGWFGQLVVRNGRLAYTNLQPDSRARVLDRSRPVMVVSDPERAAVGVALGWTERNELIAWRRDRQSIELRDGSKTRSTPARLRAEAVNATRAGDTLIASLRHPAGRETIAVSLVTGEVRWLHPDLRTLVVRCAEDQVPPCFALRTDGDRDELLPIDPSTGRFLGPPIFRGRFSDFAVSAGGERLLVAQRGNGPLFELDRTGRRLAELAPALSTVHSVAYDPLGGILVAGTKLRNVYRLVRIHDGVVHDLVESRDDLLLLVRPSRDGTRIQTVARMFNTELLILDDIP